MKHLSLLEMILRGIPQRYDLKARNKASAYCSANYVESPGIRRIALEAFSITVRSVSKLLFVVGGKLVIQSRHKVLK